MKKILLTVYFGLAIWLGNTALFFLMDIFLREWTIEQIVFQPVVLLFETIFIAKRFPRESNQLTASRRAYFTLILSPAVWYYGGNFFKFLLYKLNSYNGRYVGTAGMELYALIFALPAILLIHYWLFDRRCEKSKQVGWVVPEERGVHSR